MNPPITSDNALTVLILAIGCCAGCAQATNQSWHEKFNWQAEDYFEDPQVIALCEAIEANDLDEMKQAGAENGTSRIVDVRNAVLSGILADGSPFVFDLNPLSTSPSDYFAEAAIIRITRVPEPMALPLLLTGILVGWKITSLSGRAPKSPIVS